MGTALVNRGQPCTPTAAGTKLARHAEDIALLESHVLADIAPGSAKAAPRVRLAVNADSLATWFVPGLMGAGDMLFDLVIDDQDTSTDWLLRGAVSAAVTGQAQAVSGCNCQPLGALHRQPRVHGDVVWRRRQCRHVGARTGADLQRQGRAATSVDHANHRGKADTARASAALHPRVHRCGPCRARMGAQPAPACATAARSWHALPLAAG